MAECLVYTKFNIKQKKDIYMKTLTKRSTPGKIDIARFGYMTKGFARVV